MKIKDGGQIESLLSDKKILSIKIYHESFRTGSLMINGSSLSYLTVDELLDLKAEINLTLKSIIDGEK